MNRQINGIDHIIDNVYLGNIDGALNVDNLKYEGISKILSVTDVGAPHYKKEDNFIQKVIKVIDVPNQNIIKFFVECFKFIIGEEKVLVHCMSGASRSAAIVIAYLMWFHRMPYQDAFNFVSRKRWCVLPNSGFRFQLKQFEKLLKENNYDLSLIYGYNVF